jgi:hypothetical protein
MERGCDGVAGAAPIAMGRKEGVALGWKVDWRD